jgi:hypothetical protein
MGRIIATEIGFVTKSMGRIIVLLLLAGCTAQDVKIDPPLKFEEVKSEIQSQAIPEPVKQRTIQALTSCEDYSKKAFEIVKKNQDQIDYLKSQNSDLIAKIGELESELKPWRSLKAGFVLSVMLLVVYGLIKLYLKLKPI